MANVVASSPVPLQQEVSFRDFDDFFDNAKEVTETAKGWRMEKNSNGYYRWRWQMKSSSGKPITYTTKSGKVGYRRGSKYVSVAKNHGSN